jgi:hypothetical protein
MSDPDVHGGRLVCMFLSYGRIRKGSKNEGSEKGHFINVESFGIFTCSSGPYSLKFLDFGAW